MVENEQAQVDAEVKSLIDQLISSVDEAKPKESHEVGLID